MIYVVALAVVLGALLLYAFGRKEKPPEEERVLPVEEEEKEEEGVSIIEGEAVTPEREERIEPVPSPLPSPRYGSVSGYVRDSAGKGISGATVKFPPFSGWTRTTSDGSYSMPLYARRTTVVTVTASKSGYQAASKQVTISAGQRLTVDLVLATGKLTVLSVSFGEVTFKEVYGRIRWEVPVLIRVENPGDLVVANILGSLTGYKASTGFSIASAIPTGISTHEGTTGGLYTGANTFSAKVYVVGATGTISNTLDIPDAVSVPQYGG